MAAVRSGATVRTFGLQECRLTTMTRAGGMKRMEVGETDEGKLNEQPINRIGP
jgi:hypothetical protein